MSTVLLLALSGCTGSLKMPINKYSHFQAEATPFKNQFKVSYHLYESLPHHTQTYWQTKIKFDVIGTIYASDEIGSPAAKRIERDWERLWEDGIPSWATIERMIAYDTARLKTKHKTKAVAIKPKDYTPAHSTDLPLAGLHFFMFSSKPEW